MSLSFLDACSQGSRLPGLRQMVNAHFFLELPVGVASPGKPLLDDRVRVAIKLPFTGLTGDGQKQSWYLGKTPAEARLNSLDGKG